MKRFLILTLTGLLMAQSQAVEYTPKILPAGYRVKTIPNPTDASGREVQFGIGGIGFSPDGTAYVASRVEGIWIYKNNTWSRFSDHLHDPQGIVVLDSNSVVIAQKPELTLVKDTDGDGVADLYKTLCDAWRSSGNYCEYIHGPVRDSKGNYYVTINLADGAGDSGSWKGGGAAMATSGGYDGWYCRITADGKFEPLGSGLRSPAGIGIDPKTDRVFYTDNQGGWFGASTLSHLLPGRFYGYPASLIDDPAFRGGKKPIEKSVFEPMLAQPAVWIPYGELANSPGNPEWNHTNGKFGPFEGQVFIGDQTKSNVMRCNLEKIGGEWQGAIFDFANHLQSGCIRITFDPQGRLWVGQTGRGWRSLGNKMHGIQRIEWDGKTVPFEMHSIHLTKTGFNVTYTRPVARESVEKAGAFSGEYWHHHYHGNYGSPKVGRTMITPKVVSLSADGKTVSLEVPLKTGEIYRITGADVQAVNGDKPSTPTGYYTLNRMLN